MEEENKKGINNTEDEHGQENSGGRKHPWLTSEKCANWDGKDQRLKHGLSPGPECPVYVGSLLEPSEAACKLVLSKHLRHRSRKILLPTSRESFTNKPLAAG